MPQEGQEASAREVSARNTMHTDYATHAVQVGGNISNLHLGGQPVRVPRAEVPPTHSRFVNQERLIEWLRSMIPAPEAPPNVVVLTGPPGIGKAAAVRRFAHQNEDRFSGGQLYVDCAEPETTSSSVLTELLRSLGVSGRHMPPTVKEMTKEFRSRTAAEPVLVVLENAAEAPYVRAALPNSKGSMALVTTANDQADLGDLETDQGAVFREMRGLDEDDALRLLAAFCGAERVTAEITAARTLAALCLGIPKALVLLGTGLMRSRGLTIEHLVAELSGDNRGTVAARGERIVSEAYGFQYRRLAQPTQRLYRLLGSLPLPDLSTEAAAVAAACETDTAQRLLDGLRCADLVEERGEGRYGFHQLAREHARELAKADPPGDHEAALHALVRWFLVRAAYADRAIMGEDRTRIADHKTLLAGHDDPFSAPTDEERKAAADAWLDSERASMVPLVRAAGERGWDDEAWQLAEALVAYYYNHRQLSDWITVSNLGIRAAQRRGNEPAEARLRLPVSRAYTDRGELDRARDEVETAMTIATRGTDLKLLASAHEFRGRYLEVSDPERPERALAEYARSRDLNVQAKEPRGAALATFFAARLRAESPNVAAGELEQALRDLQESAEAFRSFPGESRMPGRALIAAGIAEARLGREEDAAATLTEAVQELGDAHYAAEALEKLADITGRSGDTATARDHLRAAFRIYERVGHPKSRAVADRLAEDANSEPGSPEG